MTERGGVSRRDVFRGALIGTSGLGVGALAGAGISHAMSGDAGAASGDDIDLSASYPFYGQGHQGGVATPPQRHCLFMAFDLQQGASAKQLQTLLARWSAAIALMQAGKPVGSVEPDSDVAVPKDTGEADGLAPASLTVTVGLGPSVFGDRFGLASFKPAIFGELPALNGDVLDPALTGGDLSVQACSDDPQVAYHAVRNLARIGRSLVQTRWTVMGFGRASAGKGQATPRNLLGFKDGTRNITEAVDMDRHVWVSGGDQPWLEGGTYQVVRKIAMLIETWDTDRIGDQQQIFGRDKQEGAPLTGEHEFDTPDFERTGDDGQPIISPTAHIALAAREHNDGVQILRRSYNYTSGLNDHGKLDAGLLFVCYQNDPGSFVRLQNRLGASDRLNEYIRHIGSAVFAVPPAPEEGQYLAEQLFT